MATVRMPSSVAARKMRIAISDRFAAMSFFDTRPPVANADSWPALLWSSARLGTVIQGGVYTARAGKWQRNDRETCEFRIVKLQLRTAHCSPDESAGSYPPAKN